MDEDLFSPFRASIHPEINCLWRGQSLLIADHHGEITGRGLNGYFFRSVRYLQKLELCINGRLLHFCSVFTNYPDTIECSMIFPEVHEGGTGGSGSGMIERQDGILERDIEIRKKCTVSPSGFDCELILVNCWEKQVRFTLEWICSADFITIDQIRSDRIAAGMPSEQEFTDQKLTIKCINPDFWISTVVQTSGDGVWEYKEGKIRAEFTLSRRERIKTAIHVRADDPDDPVDLAGSNEREQVLKNWISGLCRIETPGSEFGRVVNHSIRTVGFASLLDGAREEWLTPAAGYPLYPHLFARDALTSSWMITLFDEGKIAYSSLTSIARIQGKVVNPETDEQPGRIIQQARRDPLSRIGKNPFGCYYGDFSSPFMFIVAFTFAYAWSGDNDQLKKIWPICRRILDWAEEYGDMDGDGFLEYKTLSPDGPRNQAWKDSENAIVDEYGELVDPPIATSETQGYYYAALQAGAFFSLMTGNRKDALRYLKRAIRLKKAFNRDFWVESEGYIALGLDSKKRKIRSRTSNMGHCLATGIIDSEKVPLVVKALFSPDMFSGWGVRTLSSAHPSFNPLDYHLGSIWPVENASIAFGLRRYGFDREAMDLIKANFDLALHWRNDWVPECVGGYDRELYGHPGAFPRANIPQTWNAAAFGLFVNILCGFQPFAPLNILFLDPLLPDWLPELNLKSLRFRGSVFDLHVHKTRSGKTKFRLRNKKGRPFIIRQQPYNSLSASIWRRLLSAAGLNF